jgi:hypothetical protein
MRERNPKDFFEVRKVQLKDSTPVVGKLRRKKAIQEICNTKFDGWFDEKISAVVEGLGNDDEEIRKFAQDYLMSLDLGPANKDLVMALCDNYLKTKNNHVLHVLRRKKIKPRFSNIYDTIEFYSAVFGVEATSKAIERLSIEDSFKIMETSSNEDLKKALRDMLFLKVNQDHVSLLLELFRNQPNYCYCELIEKYFDFLSFREKVTFIQYIPAMKGYDGNREAYTNKIVSKLNQCVREKPETMDSLYAIQEYDKNPYNHWLLGLVKNNRDVLSLKDELVLCNYFKEYKKVREIIDQFTLDDTCKYFEYFVGTPLDCMFQQKIRLYIKRQNYNFNFNTLKDAFPCLEETLKLEVFRMLKNYSTPTYVGFLFHQMGRISQYTTEEQNIFLNDLIPYYIPMFFKLKPNVQQVIIRTLPDMDYVTLDFFVRVFLKSSIDMYLITFFEILISESKFTEDQKVLILEILIERRPSLFEKSRILTKYRAIYEQKIMKLERLIQELQNQCSRQYIRDDNTGHNEEIDRKRALIKRELAKIDIEKAIPLLLNHFNEKNYRLKKDVKEVLETTKVGFRYLIPYAFTDGIQDKEHRDFSVYLLEKRIRPYVPFRPEIIINYDNLKYVEFFLSEQNETFQSLARLVRKCNIITARKTT